jgi:hypothetical protein
MIPPFPGRIWTSSFPPESHSENSRLCWYDINAKDWVLAVPVLPKYCVATEERAASPPNVGRAG